MMNKSLALFGVLSGMVFFTPLSFAKDETFNVYKKCHDEMEWSCDVIRNTNGKKEKVYGGMKSPNIERLNQSYYHVQMSCGSPCQAHNICRLWHINLMQLKSCIFFYRYCWC